MGAFAGHRTAQPDGETDQREHSHDQTGEASSRQQVSLHCRQRNSEHDPPGDDQLQLVRLEAEPPAQLPKRPTTRGRNERRSRQRRRDRH